MITIEIVRSPTGESGSFPSQVMRDTMIPAKISSAPAYPL